MCALASIPRTLIIGSTGCIGRFVAEACLASGIPTYILIRSARNSPSKTKTIKLLQDKGAIVVHHKIEVVISTVVALLEQLILVEAIKAVGTIKRFLPSEFGHDVDRADPVEPGLMMYNMKRKVRRAIEDAGIPYTYVCCNAIAGWPYFDNTHPCEVPPPLDEFKIYGDGTVKAYFITGSDIGKFTAKIITDDRAVNKTVHFRPPSNLFNVNGLASLWEKKIGRTLPRTTITEEDLLTAAKELPFPGCIVAAFTHDVFIKGCQVNYSLDKPSDVEVCSLYPNTLFQTVAECFDDFVVTIPDVSKASHN
ncbi:hypothetical protein TIFTF001_027006 [Ficus carica]|uniref:NmrA-like domain-containing protein n=1 Tax=Ficus carica TaxID=3494 RepID=A0AA88IZI0_FICCA|nr:hypothetical protein TIFTF001_027006 [Ficus carica]